MLCKCKKHFKYFYLNTKNNAIRYLLVHVQSFGKLQKKKRLEGQKALRDKMLHECFIKLLTTF